MMRHIFIVLLIVLVIGCTAEQEQQYITKYKPIVQDETRKIVENATNQLAENLTKQNEELKQQLENINKILGSSKSKGDGSGGGGIGTNRTSPQNPPSDNGPCINTTTFSNNSIENLGDTPIDIRINPVNYECTVREEGDVEKKQFNEIFPKDVNVENASALEEKIPEEQQELVKNYFNNVNK